MNYKQLFFKVFLFISAITIGAGKCQAGEYSYTFTAKQYSANGTKKLNGINWTLAGDGGYWGYDGTKGQQLGSGSSPYKSLTFSTDEIPGTITNIVLNTSGAKDINAKLNVTVGGTQYGKTISLTSTATEYTFEGSASGTVVFNYTQTSKKAIYIKSITVTYSDGTPSKEKQTLSFSQTSFTIINDGSNFVEPTLNGAMTDVTYTSSAESVAMVDANTGEVTIKGEGTAVITATAVENEDYEAGTASYTITIEAPVSSEGYMALVGSKKGKYYAMTSVRGDNNMAAQEVSVVNGKVVLMAGESPANIMWKITDNGTTSTIQDRDGKYLVCGSGSTNLFTQANSYSWKNSDEHSSWISSTDANRSFIYSTSNSGIFKNYAVSNIGAAAYSETYTTAMPIAEGYSRSGLADGKYGTICLPYAVAASDIVGMEIYSVEGKRLDGEGEVSSLVIALETEIQAGVPYIFKATAESTIVAYSGEEADIPGSANGLIGVFADTRPIPGDNNYVISSNTIKKAGANAGVRANCAYIDMDAVPLYQEGSSAKRIFEIGNGNTTSILSPLTGSEGKVDVYSITGMMIRKGVERSSATIGLGKGLYIVGGKKVIVK